MPSGENKGRPGSPGWQPTDQSQSAGKIPPIVDVPGREKKYAVDETLDYEAVWETYRENIVIPSPVDEAATQAYLDSFFADKPEKTGPSCGACGEPVDLAGPWSKHVRLGCYLHTTCDHTNVMGEDVSMDAMQVFYPMERK